MTVLDKFKTDALTYARKLVKLQVYFATEDGFLTTAEGPVTYTKGDALVTGTKGEKWPVQRERFEATYVCASPLYGMGENCFYNRKPADVLALQLTEPISIPLSNGRGELKGEIGDWLVQGPGGDFWVVGRDFFGDLYGLKSNSLSPSI